MYCYNKNISFNRVAVKRLCNCLQIVSTLYRESNKICHKQSSFVVFLEVVYQFQFISIALVTTRNKSGRRSTPASLCLLWGQFAGVPSSEGVQSGPNQPGGRSPPTVSEAVPCLVLYDIFIFRKKNVCICLLPFLP